VCVYIYIYKIYIEYCLYDNHEQYCIQSYMFMFYTEKFVLKEHFLYFPGKMAKNNEVHRTFLGCVTASMQLFLHCIRLVKNY